MVGVYEGSVVCTGLAGLRDAQIAGIILFLGMSGRVLLEQISI